MKRKIEVLIFISVICAVGILLRFFILDLYAYVIVFAKIDFTTESSKNIVALSYPFIASGIPILIALIINMFRESHAPMDIRKLKRPDLKPLAISVSIGILILLGIATSTRIIFDILPPQRNIDSLLVKLTLAVILAPIFEEVIYRGVIQSELTRIFKPWVAIVISAAIFGVAHLHFFQSSYAFVSGVFMGWVYYKTQNLTYAIILHMCANLFNLTVGSLAKYFHWEPNTYVFIFILVGSLIAIPVLVRYLHHYWQRTGADSDSSA